MQMQVNFGPSTTLSLFLQIAVTGYVSGLTYKSVDGYDVYNASSYAVYSTSNGRSLRCFAACTKDSNCAIYIRVAPFNLSQARTFQSLCGEKTSKK